MYGNVTVDRRRTDSNVLSKGWQREDVLRKAGLSAGKVDIFYYSPSGKKNESNSQLARQLDQNVLDITKYDFQPEKHPTCLHSILSMNQRSSFKRKFIKTRVNSIIGPDCISTSGSVCSILSAPRHHLEFSRGIRTDISLVPPIRQTASIFKQPVTVIKNHENSRVKHDPKHGQEKPKQLFWEKRLEGLRACNIVGEEFNDINLPGGIKAVGPNVFEQTVLQSIATSLHISTQPVTGQTANHQALILNSGAYLNPDQPLMQSVSVSDDDIKKQEDRVSNARKKLQEALK